MTNEEIKRFIAGHVAQGISLSKIQDMLLEEKKVKMTFMELRMIASEIENADWSKLDKPEPKTAQKDTPPQDEMPEETQDGFPPEQEPPQEETAAAAPSASSAPEETGKIRGKTVVELSKLVKPGTIANGSVTFGSGVTADWFVDQSGRLGLSNNTGKPDAEDVKEFQIELQKLFGA